MELIIVQSDKLPKPWTERFAHVNAVMQVNNPCHGFDYSFIKTRSCCKRLERGETDVFAGYKRHASLKLSAKFIMAYSKF